MKRTSAQLNKRIELMVYTETDDGIGGVVTELVPVFPAWAAIWPVRSKEFRENLRTKMNTTHNIRMYYRPGVTPDMQVRYKGRLFEIKGIINPDEDNRFLDLVCNET